MDTQFQAPPAVSDESRGPPHEVGRPKLACLRAFWAGRKGGLAVYFGNRTRLARRPRHSLRPFIGPKTPPLSPEAMTGQSPMRPPLPRRIASRARACPWDGAATAALRALWQQCTSSGASVRVVAKAPARRNGQALARRLWLDSGPKNAWIERQLRPAQPTIRTCKHIQYAITTAYTTFSL